MKLVKAKMQSETVTFELTFDELLVVTDMITDAPELYKNNPAYNLLSRGFVELSTNILNLNNAMKKVGAK